MSQFESLIDSTNFGTVRRYLHGCRSPITTVLFVREEPLLATVAALITQEHPTDAQRAQFAGWIRDGALKVGVQHVPLSGDDDRIDVDSVSEEARCRVLFLPPYYLVHLRSPWNGSVSTATHTLSRD